MKSIRNLVYILAVAMLCMGCASSTETNIVADNQMESADNREDTITNTEEIREEETDTNQNFWIKYLEVGQADAALVYSSGHYMLIDGGKKEDSSLIYSVLREHGVETLDYVIGSHPHIDHIGGLPAAYNHSTVGETFCSVKTYDTYDFADFYKYACMNGQEIIIPKAGDTYDFGPARIDILGVNAGESINDGSIILKITYEDTSFLFTGDAEYLAEKAVIESGADLSATVLKVGHHGSDTSSSYQFLRKVNPEVAIISVGTDNEYGHPTETVLSRLSDCGSKIYRTDLQGDITVYSDGTNVWVETEREAADEEIMVPGIWINGAISDEEATVYTDIEADYICNENSRKFHYPTCDSVVKMSEKNKRYYNGSREDLMISGYEPCGGCKP